jgi:hypothetical protein
MIREEGLSMIKRLRLHLECLRAARWQAQWDAGYDWAAGTLLQSNGLQDPRHHISYERKLHGFDEGIRDAVRDYTRLTGRVPG